MISMSLVAITAWFVESEFTTNQSKLILRLGEDISSNQNKWENAKLSEAGAFSWWIDLDLGHRLTKETSLVTQLSLLCVAVQLATTLFVQKRKKNKIGPTGSCS